MQFKLINNRHKSYFSKSEEQGSTDNAARLIVAIIDKLDVEKLGFAKDVT